MEVAAQVDACFEHRVHLIGNFAQKPWAKAVLRVGYAVFQNIDRLAQGTHRVGGDSDTMGITFAKGVFVSVVSLRNVEGNKQASEQGAVF